MPQQLYAETVWADDSGQYFIRRNDGATVDYVTPDGTVATPGNGLRPAGETAGGSYALASGIALAASTGSTPIAGVKSASYIFAAIFTGASVKLQALGPDGSSWIDVWTLTGAGQQGVVLGVNATVRLYNPGGTALTDLSASLT